MQYSFSHLTSLLGKGACHHPSSRWARTPWPLTRNPWCLPNSEDQGELWTLWLGDFDYSLRRIACLLSIKTYLNVEMITTKWLQVTEWTQTVLLIKLWHRNEQSEPCSCMNVRSYLDEFDSSIRISELCIPQALQSLQSHSHRVAESLSSQGDLEFRKRKEGLIRATSYTDNENCNNTRKLESITNKPSSYDFHNSHACWSLCWQHGVHFPFGQCLT